MTLRNGCSNAPFADGASRVTAAVAASAAAVAVVVAVFVATRPCSGAVRQMPSLQPVCLPYNTSATSAVAVFDSQGL